MEMSESTPFTVVKATGDEICDLSGSEFEESFRSEEAPWKASESRTDG